MSKGGIYSYLVEPEAALGLEPRDPSGLRPDLRFREVPGDAPFPAPPRIVGPESDRRFENAFDDAQFLATENNTLENATSFLATENNLET